MLFPIAATPPSPPIPDISPQQKKDRRVKRLSLLHPALRTVPSARLPLAARANVLPQQPRRDARPVKDMPARQLHDSHAVGVLAEANGARVLVVRHHLHEQLLPRRGGSVGQRWTRRPTRGAPTAGTAVPTRRCCRRPPDNDAQGAARIAPRPVVRTAGASSCTTAGAARRPARPVPSDTARRAQRAAVGAPRRQRAAADAHQPVVRRRRCQIDERQHPQRQPPDAAIGGSPTADGS